MEAVSFILRIEGGISDDGLLDIYDCANTTLGLARSANLVAHSLANEEEVRKRNQRAEGAKAYIKPPIRGCFEEVVEIRFDSWVVDKIGPSVFKNVFWDYMGWVWNSAAGESFSPETAYVKKISRENQDFIYEISNALEVPLALVHKAILRDDSVKIYLNRPRVGDYAVFDKNTLDYVTIREGVPDVAEFIGNVTRYSALSQYGRLYSSEEGRVISFEFDENVNQAIRNVAIESMRAYENGDGVDYLITASVIVSALGIVKRYIVHNVQALD